MEAAYQFGLDCGRANGNLTPRPTLRLKSGMALVAGCSEKPNNPPGKPAGFLYNNQAVRPAMDSRNVGNSFVRP